MAIVDEKTWDTVNAGEAPPPPPGEFPWMWLAIGGAALAGVILLIPKAKEKIEKK